MSDSPYGGLPAGPSPWMPQGPTPSNNPSRIPLIIAIVVALLTLALAAAAWFKPAPHATPATPQYREQQTADAKKNLCEAYDTMHRAISSAGSLSSEDPNQKFMVSINTRLAFNSAADHLLAAANQNPAAPTDLLTASQNLALSYQKIVLAQTEPATQDILDSLYKEADSSVSIIKQQCG